jgi:hypothetical protein
MRSTGVPVSTALLAAAALATACSQGALTFDAIQLGRGLNADRTISQPTTRFKPSDTVYVAVLTGGSGSGTVKARWLYAGRVISEPEQKVRYQGPGVTEFHLQKSDGFPPGDYTVELFLDGVAVGTREFRVETGNPKDLYTFPNTTPKR